jgi:hypothetical protein
MVEKEKEKDEIGAQGPPFVIKFFWIQLCLLC